MMYSIINLLCGIGLFLFGMSLMSESTTAAFGESLKGTLSVLTKNRLSGVLTGLAVTGIIQSSCATTVAAVSFVSAGLLSLSGAAGIIMGANIGTTVTSLLIAFDFSDIAPVAVFLGTVLKMFSKKQKTQFCFFVELFCFFTQNSDSESRFLSFQNKKRHKRTCQGDTPTVFFNIRYQLA